MEKLTTLVKHSTIGGSVFILFLIIIANFNPSYLLNGLNWIMVIIPLSIYYNLKYFFKLFPEERTAYKRVLTHSFTASFIFTLFVSMCAYILLKVFGTSILTAIGETFAQTREELITIDPSWKELEDISSQIDSKFLSMMLFIISFAYGGFCSLIIAFIYRRH